MPRAKARPRRFALSQLHPLPDELARGRRAWGERLTSVRERAEGPPISLRFGFRS
jgi:hypothetical protein